MGEPEHPPDEADAPNLSSALTFNHVLTNAGYALSDVRLLRHQEPAARRGRTAYELWRDERAAFDIYQSQQDAGAAPKLGDAKYWASFVATAEGETMFAGFYRAKPRGISTESAISPTTGTVWAPGSLHLYELRREDFLKEFAGRIFIEWGAGRRAWIQRADRQQKPIVEIRRVFSEPAFPGYLELIEDLSRVATLPSGWIQALKVARGVYLLTCPRNNEWYVGSATGADGFFGRWMEYARDGHGGNVQLRHRDPTDWQVSILEVAGSSASDVDVIHLEMHWKRKLQTLRMGLNSN